MRDAPLRRARRGRARAGARHPRARALVPLADLPDEHGAGNVHGLLLPRARDRRRAGRGRASAKTAASLAGMREHLEGELAANGPYILGERFTSADLYLSMLTRWGRRLPSRSGGTSRSSALTTGSSPSARRSSASTSRKVSRSRGGPWPALGRGRIYPAHTTGARRLRCRGRISSGPLGPAPRPRYPSSARRRSSAGRAHHS